MLPLSSVNCKQGGGMLGWGWSLHIYGTYSRISRLQFMWEVHEKIVIPILTPLWRLCLRPNFKVILEWLLVYHFQHKIMDTFYKLKKFLHQDALHTEVLFTILQIKKTSWWWIVPSVRAKPHQNNIYTFHIQFHLQATAY